MYKKKGVGILFQKFKTIKMNIIFTYVSVFIGTLIFLNILVYQLSIKVIVDTKKDVFYSNQKFFTERIKEFKTKKIMLSKIKIEDQIKSLRIQNSDFYIKITGPDNSEVGEIPEGITLNLEKYNELITVDGDDEKEYFYLNEKLNYDGDDYIFQYLLVTDYEQYFKILMKILIFVELIGIFISILMGIKIGNKVVNPINKISDMVEIITSKNLTERLPIKNEAYEIARLSNLINMMFERLEKSFENQKNFISNISHELRTPIAVIKGYLDLYRKVGADNAELVEEAITAIEEENENINRMIEKLLFLARNDIEKLQLNIVNLDMNTFFKKLKNDYKSIENSRKLKVFVEPNSYLKCDTDILLQILRALIDNAIKYGGDNGIDIGYYKTQNQNIIYVKDYGNGMDKDEVEKIFHRFYRGDKSRNRDNGSVGLGLSIVENLAELHRCKIEVDSKVGKGTTFKVIFNNNGGNNEENFIGRGR